MRTIVILALSALFSVPTFAQDACVDGAFCDANGDAHNCDTVDTVTTCVNNCRVLEEVARCTLNDGDNCIDVVEVCGPTSACTTNSQGQYSCQPSLDVCNPDVGPVCSGNRLVWLCFASDDLPAAFIDDCTALGGTCDESIAGCSGIENGGTCDQTPGCTVGQDCFWACEETCSSGVCVEGSTPPPPPPGEGEGEGEAEGPGAGEGEGEGEGETPGDGEGEGENFEQRDREEGQAPTNCSTAGGLPTLPFAVFALLVIVRRRPAHHNRV